MPLDMLLPEAGAIYVRGSWLRRLCAAFMCCTKSGAFFVTRAKSNIDAHRVYSAPTDRSTGIICDQTISLDGFYTRPGSTPNNLRRIRFKDPESGKTLVFMRSNNLSLPAATICRALSKAAGRWNSSSSGSSSLFGSSSAYEHVGERGEDADLRLPSRSTSSSPSSKSASTWIASLYTLITDPYLGDPLRENAHTSSTCGRRKQMQRFANNQPIEFIRFLTGH